MDDLALDYLRDFYSKSLRLHGDRPEALRWSAKGQLARYARIASMLELGGSSVLDYGCGKADLLGYLKSQGTSVRYTGVDINTDLIRLARGKYPEAGFFVADVERDGLPGAEPYDYTIMCGVYNNRIQGATQSMLNAMTLLYARTSRALLVIALSSNTRDKSTDLNYVDPAAMRHAAERLCGSTSTKEHPDGDLTLVMTRPGQ